MGILSETSSGSQTAKAPSRQRIKRGSASVQLHDSLRERIVSLELKPGQYLSRNEIASEYGVSQTPVRDALIKLEEEGLIVTYPQSKTEVTRIDVDHALETHFLRLSVELEVTRRLALAQDKTLIAKARSLLAQQEAARDAGDMAAFSRLDRDFHLSLYQAAGVGHLHRVIEDRSGHIDRLRKLHLPDPGKRMQILQLHGRILDGIQASDVAATEAAVREHLTGTLAKVADIRARHADYF